MLFLRASSSSRPTSDEASADEEVQEVAAGTSVAAPPEAVAWAGEWVVVLAAAPEADLEAPAAAWAEAKAQAVVLVADQRAVVRSYMKAPCRQSHSGCG